MLDLVGKEEFSEIKSEEAVWKTSTQCLKNNTFKTNPLIMVSGGNTPSE